MEEDFGDTYRSFGQSQKQQQASSQSKTVSSRPKSTTKVAKTKDGFLMIQRAQTIFILDG